MLDGLRTLLVLLDTTILTYFVVSNSVQGALLLVAAGWLVRHARRRRGPQAQEQVKSSLLPQVSLLVPAFNEDVLIVQTVRAMLALNYPRLEVIVVNDGSTDRTLEQLVSHFELSPVVQVASDAISSRPVRSVLGTPLLPQLVVVDKENGGKADALNAALRYASGDLVCALDADTVVEADALGLLTVPMIEDEEVIAVGGLIRAANGSLFAHGRIIERRAPSRLLTGVQEVEYSRAFLFGRLGLNPFGGNIIISGAFGLFRRRALLDAGGYATDTVGEDMELVMRLRRRSYETGKRHRAVFIPDPVAWTEVPERPRALARQRNRWYRGLCDVLVRHRAVLARPRYGAMGMLIVPYYLLIELLAPIVEAVGLVGLAAGLAFRAVDLWFAAGFWLIAYGLSLILSFTSLYLEDILDQHRQRPVDRLRRHLWAVAEQLGYRQCTVVWRLWGLQRALRSDHGWGEQTRRGFPTQ